MSNKRKIKNLSEIDLIKNLANITEEEARERVRKVREEYDNMTEEEKEKDREYFKEHGLFGD